MLLAGLLLRNIPYITDAVFIDTHWSAALRNIALAIILTRAGLGLNPSVPTPINLQYLNTPWFTFSCFSVCPAGTAASQSGVYPYRRGSLHGGGLHHRCGFSLPAQSAMGLGLHSGVKQEYSHTFKAWVKL